MGAMVDGGDRGRMQTLTDAKELTKMAIHGHAE
jgi:hypothetical protein